MPYFLALDCSMPLADVSLLKKSKESLELIANSHWTHKAFKSAHSDRLPLEIDKLLKKAGVHLRELNHLVVGVGPGRFTGVRTALTVAKALSFSLKIPVYPVNSLKLLAEEFYETTRTLFVAIHAFKNQVYFAEFYPQKENIFVLTFKQWQRRIENLSQTLKQKKIICVSDLDNFYHLESHLNRAVLFKKPKISSFNLAKIVLREEIQAQNWSELKACYLRSAL
ncbi:MAG: tRNA (adenosine(37)-N6)-threonylcarbamoyltransferase complex dimerization subunit type 1 TsaB [Oligoflexia bacterium]|nr:tRNA (adenosine(37)-N6)-threonylcarbamoyltransferase complex dimerization subunit type 1 TsaB [Oligoflexia bacterium]